MAHVLGGAGSVFATPARGRRLTERLQLRPDGCPGAAHPGAYAHRRTLLVVVEIEVVVQSCGQGHVIEEARQVVSRKADGDDRRRSCCRRWSPPPEPHVTAVRRDMCISLHGAGLAVVAGENHWPDK